MIGYMEEGIRRKEQDEESECVLFILFGRWMILV